jgi:hypothetical protein
VRFIRPQGLQPLPTPRRGGSIDELRPFLNVKTEEQFILSVAWIVAALRNRGPYPVLIVSGEQGTAKSTFLRVLRDLIDPHVAPLRVLPKDDRELFIQATNSHMLAFDNLSCMSAEMSDSLCRIATGGSISSRKLYSDGEEALFTAQRPIALNGIEDTATRGDLASRAIVIELEPIAEEDRKTEEEFYAAFEKAKPAIFGALLDLLSEGLRRLPLVTLAKAPRMADFAKFATAAETAHWPDGSFLRAYAANQGDATEAVLESHPVAGAIIAFVVEQRAWSGTAALLLKELSERAGEKAKDRRWPKDATRMGGELRRLAPALRRKGMLVETDERTGKDRRRKIQLGIGAMSIEES